MTIEGFNRILPRIDQINREIEGHLTSREARFLALVSAWPTCKPGGIILEIGSFKGRSTLILHEGRMISDQAPLVSVDPLESSSPTDPGLIGNRTVAEDFFMNLEAYGVKDQLEFHQCFSADLAKHWNRPIRFLWIDGDHTYKGAKSDFDGFSPFLEDGAIVALHDILIGYPGPIRVFMEDILLSERFCAAGLCGSIGWAQYRKGTRASQTHQRHKSKLYKALARLVPLYVFNDAFPGKWSHYKYRLFRAFVPHREIRPEIWMKMVDRAG